MDVSNYLHTLGDKITYKIKEGKLKVYIRASNRGDKQRLQQIRRRVFFLCGFGLFLLPILVLSAGTNFIFVLGTAALLWTLLLTRSIYTYFFIKDGMEVLTVSQGIMDYTSGFFAGGDRMILKRRRLSHPFNIEINNKQTVVHGVQFLEEEKTSSVSFFKDKDATTMRLNVSEEVGEKLRLLINEHAN
jgi:hypothetical protein